ncbi:MAG TPA: hypothetical protein VNK91_01990 [Burkholderiaceae bacterium]|nr:hypothetical protein [Burkholderiaceae bacterium]
MGWTDTIRAAAPLLGTLLGGPLVGTAVRVLGDTLLGKPDATEAEIEQVVAAGLTPEQLAALKQADVRLKEIGLEEFRVAAADTAHARDAHKGDRGVYWLGIAVLVTFAAVMTAAMYGSYQILVGGLQIKDAGVIAAVFGFLGTVVGYVAANAQQVVAYFFGSSRGSKEKTDAMAQAFTNLRR